MRLTSEQDTTGTMPCIFVIVALGCSWLHGEGNQTVSKQLTGTLIKTDQRMERIVRPGILIKDIFHMPDIITGHVSDTPTLV
jgi:hypothetical protein